MTYDFSKHRTILPIASYFGLTLVNTMCLYGTFVAPIFTAAAASILSNPLFLGPSLMLNFAMHQKYFILFQGANRHCQNIYLKPDGKSVFLETRDGESTEVQNTRFFDPKQVQTYF